MGLDLKHDIEPAVEWLVGRVPDLLLVYWGLAAAAATAALVPGVPVGFRHVLACTVSTQGHPHTSLTSAGLQGRCQAGSKQGEDLEHQAL